MSNICSHSSKPQQEFLETHQFHVYSIFQFQPCIFVLMLRSCALRIEILASFLGRLLSCERHARIGLFIQLSWFFMHNISISMSTLPFRLDVTVLNWKSSHILVLSLRLLSVNDTQAYGLFIQLSWEVSISRLCLEAWRILTFVESNISSTAHVCVSWR